MKRIRIPFLVVAVSLITAGMAFAIDIPAVSTWTQSVGVGGGGPGRGDVLLGSLYDVRNITDHNLPPSFQTPQSQQTLINLVNTDTTFGVVARIRFREWKRSREVLDLDIPLTTNDVWTAQIARLPGGGAVLQSNDRWISATPSPDPNNSPFPSGFICATDFGLGVTCDSNGVALATPDPRGGGIPFVPFLIESTEANPLARTELGYFEIIGEERVKAITPAGLFPRLGTIVPCISYTPGSGDPAGGPGGGRDVQNVLMGTTFILRADQAISHQYNMNALSDFAVADFGIWSSPASAFPTLFNQVQGEPNQCGAGVPNPGIGGFNQLEAILSKRLVMAQYANGVLQPSSTPATTSLVITYPTKHFHYPGTATTLPATTLPPFTAVHELDGEIFNPVIYDRNENSFQVPPGKPISPPPVINVLVPSLPYEVNVVGLDPHDPAVVDFRNNLALPTANSVSGQTFNTGWVKFDLSPPSFGTTDSRTVPQGESGISFSFFNNFFGAVLPAGQVAANCGTAASPVACPGAYRGLPAIGVVMTEFFNDSVAGYFGNCVPWQYAVDFGDLPVFP